MQVLSIQRGQLRAAWSGLWLVQALDEHCLVAIPRLRLAQEVALELVSRIPYSTVFRDAVMSVREDPPRPFVVVHATFDLYRTGEPDISGFAAFIPFPGVPLPPQGVVITRTAQMLRGEV